MVSFGYDYHWALQDSRFDHEERGVQSDKFAFVTYLSYLAYAPLYLAGPILSFNAFASQICGIEVPENMPKCVNNCYNLESFWKNWHASYNKWLVRYLYIPLGGSQRKLLNVWVVFTFVAIWHDLEWKLLSWAWLTCLFFIPEIIFKSAANAFQAKTALGEFIVREFSAAAGAITITCLMVANLVGFVIGPSGISWLVSQFLSRKGLPVLAGMLLTFYVGTKLMFHIRDAKQSTTKLASHMALAVGPSAKV
ncbi:hypothetical protein ACLB2K_077265 [Fragaria x ananassa]